MVLLRLRKLPEKIMRDPVQQESNTLKTLKAIPCNHLLRSLLGLVSLKKELASNNF